MPAHRLGLAGIFFSSAAVTLSALIPCAPAVAQTAPQVQELSRLTSGNIEHCTEAIRGRKFLDIFVCGDELFDTKFNSVDGVGANLGNGQRFTRVPRYDLPEYASGPVARSTGPDAQSCAECHPGLELGGAGDGPGTAALNNIQDRVGPSGRGNPAGFVTRNPPTLQGLAGIQLVAEEMTRGLQGIRASAIQLACASSAPQTARLMAKGVSFGELSVVPGPAGGGCAAGARIDTSRVQGVDPDLVVRAFGLEGLTASLRSFVLVAFHNELGMEPVEFTGADADNDRDGVSNEILIDDASAMAMYLAAQPRPVRLTELDDLRTALRKTPEGAGIAAKLPIPALGQAERAQLKRGEQLFRDIGCARCHIPSMVISNKIFAEPSRLAAFRQPGDRSPAGIDLIAAGVDPARPLSFDITVDPPDNQFRVGEQVLRLGAFRTNEQGQAIGEFFSDFKRHDMGRQNAEEVDRRSEGGFRVPGSVFITAELWGIGSSAPYLHDGSATTIQEAVTRGHGGEAAPERDAFRKLDAVQQADLVSFLTHELRMFFPADEEPEPVFSRAD